MEREILFRGKRVDTGKWVYGSYIKCSNLPLTELHLIEEYYDNKWEVNPESVGQYTGLLDKDGNKIFEGDIVNSKKWVSTGKYDDCCGVIKYKSQGFTIKLLGEWEGSDADLNGNAVVIGNIFNNPELIKYERN